MAMFDCSTCKHFKRLWCPNLELDFGFCTNPLSPWYYVVLFEHHPACGWWEYDESQMAEAKKIIEKNEAD